MAVSQEAYCDGRNAAWEEEDVPAATAAVALDGRFCRSPAALKLFGLHHRRR